MAQRKDGLETKQRILSACVRLFIEQGYHATTVSQIIAEANVSRGSYQNLFHTKDEILLELTQTMFSGQFAAARTTATPNLPPVYVYATETALQLTIAELNENLRDIYVEAYTVPATLDFIRVQTSKKLYKIFGERFPEFGEFDFYELDVGSSGLMRGFMQRKCDMHFTLERKLQRFIEASLRVYRVSDDEIAAVCAFVAGLDVRSIANQIMQGLFSMLQMKYDFKLENSNTGVKVADATADTI